MAADIKVISDHLHQLVLGPQSFEAKDKLKLKEILVPSTVAHLPLQRGRERDMLLVRLASFLQGAHASIRVAFLNRLGGC